MCALSHCPDDGHTVLSYSAVYRIMRKIRCKIFCSKISVTVLTMQLCGAALPVEG